jgi:hypothetical protein
MFVVTTGVAAPVGPLAAEARVAPTVYVGLAFHRGRSRTSFEIGQSFTTYSTGGDQHASISVTAVTVTRVIPIASKFETYVALEPVFDMVGAWADCFRSNTWDSCTVARCSK